MSGVIEFGKCDFCKEEKPVWRTYLYPSKYQKPELFEERRILHNQGDYFIYISTCNDCGNPATYEQLKVMNGELIQELSDKVKESKDIFIAEVNRLNYVIKLMNESSGVYTDSSLISAVKGVVKSHEDYINSKIIFTEKYFEEKYKQ